MRTPWITGKRAIHERLTTPGQVHATDESAALPPYLASFLAHLRLLVGVPFDYLIPDSRLLPPESIRFFYVDRSWADRLVDGALAVGKIGSREQAHHQEHHPSVRQELDVTERSVRALQRRREPGPATTIEADVVTGFLLRSSAVSGWPHMDVCAFSRTFDGQPVDVKDPKVNAYKMRLLRLERLSPSVLLAMFEGIPSLVWCEEPHHGVQFGVQERNGKLGIRRHGRDGTPISTVADATPVPLRAGGKRVIHVRELHRRLAEAAKTDARMPAQDGSAAFAIELLDLPWRQRFQGEGGAGVDVGPGAHVPLSVAKLVFDPLVREILKEKL